MDNPPELFLASLFSGDGHATRESGLLIATSRDGVTFRNIRDSLEPLYMPVGGVRDPSLLYWHGHWQLVHSYGQNLAPLLFLAQSPNLRHWTPVGALRLAADTANNYVDVPQWLVDPAGQVHLIACVDDQHHWVESHPLSPAPASWGDPAQWSAPITLTDDAGQPLVQGNSFVAMRDSGYVMAFNDIASTVYYQRRSASLTSGWGAPRLLPLDPRVHHGDSENLIVLADGALRFYISNGNALQKVMWYVDSADDGLTWTAPRQVLFEGFGPAGVNWAQIGRGNW